ncbi:MAG: hypothetical protein CMB99_07805 [Flavobacteriaceae bacterium]|nr:hypothetical protein [Flavobacteriaceae bacterium]|tara:strand:- start:16384 stop:16944 length:561 start_codon:yes stop_codon:yes gene_type:complete
MSTAKNNILKGIKSIKNYALLLGCFLIAFSCDYSNMNRSEQISIGNKLKIEGEVTKVQVVSPIDKDSVNCRILTMGVYPKNHTKDIWVIIHPTDDRYYPQSDHTNTSYKRDGEWQVVTRFGGDLGEKYDLIIYETDSTASSFFSKTIENWKSLDKFPGLETAELPEGAVEVDRIVVYNNKNCRGVF